MAVESRGWRDVFFKIYFLSFSVFCFVLFCLVCLFVFFFINADIFEPSTFSLDPRHFTLDPRHNNLDPRLSTKTYTPGKKKKDTLDRQSRPDVMIKILGNFRQSRVRTMLSLTTQSESIFSSRVEGRGSRVPCRGSRVSCRGSRVTFFPNCF